MLPIIPMMLAFDGVVSCLRTYTPDELLAMAHEARAAPLPTIYLIGVPRRG